MPYVIQRADKDGKPRYTGMYRTKDGPYRSAGTYDDHRRAYEVAEQEEQHIHSLLQETSPADKARMTFLEFGETRFFPRHRASAATMQGYFSVAQLYIYPYLGRLRVSEVNRETYYNLLIKTLPQAEVPHSAILATRKVLSAMCEMAWNEGYRSNNPVRSIRLPSAPTKPVLVASHDQWRLLEEALTYPPARLHARLNVTTWARRCELISLRPCDFDFGKQLLTITRSSVRVGARFHPTGRAGWITNPHPKNGDWRRFTISKQMCTALQDHIDEYSIADDALLFPQWMFAYKGLITPDQAADPDLPPLITKTGKIHHHGTTGARYGMNCTCPKCRSFAAAYQRDWRRRQPTTSTRANPFRTDGTEFLTPAVWTRFWNHARAQASLPPTFTPYNARHTGISWAIAKGIDLQKVRQRAGHGSLEVTSRYAAILNEEDTTLADALEEIFDTFTP